MSTSPSATPRQVVARLVGPRGRALFRRLRPDPPAEVAPQLVARPTSQATPRVLWPLYAPPRYLGQLDDAFQASLAAERAYIGPEDCDIYHTVDLPDGGTLQGVWDLRGRESSYFGDVEVGGQRVLELGPASGGTTAWMERQGAEVVCVDAGYDLSIDLVPWKTWDLRGHQLKMMQLAGATQNAWWYTKRLLDLRAKMVYAPIYELPGDIGRFDVSVYAAILLHISRPFDALAEAARITDRMIVVTDPHDPSLSGPVMRFNPGGHGHPTSLWWQLTPEVVTEFLRVLGFPNARTTYHEQLHHFDHDRSVPARPFPLYTVVATR